MHCRDSPPSQQRFINGVIDFEKEFSQNLKDNESADDYVTMIIPSGDMQDGMIYDSCSLEKNQRICISETLQRHHRLRNQNNHQPSPSCILFKRYLINQPPTHPRR